MVHKIGKLIVNALAFVLLWMPIQVNGYEWTNGNVKYSFRIANGEATITHVEILESDIIGGVSMPSSVMVEEKHGFDTVITWYPVRCVGDGDLFGVYGDVYLHHCTALSIMDGIVEIGAYAFKGYGWFTGVAWPNSVQKVGKDAFVGCGDLGWIATTNLAAWCDIDFANAGANPLMCTSQGLAWTDWTYFINGYPVSSPLRNLVIPNEIRQIKQYTFYGHKTLESVVFPSSCTSIGTYAFYGCTNLFTLTLHDNITNVDSSAFQGCTGLRTVSLGNGLTSVSSNLFQGCYSLLDADLGENVKTISAHAFEGCTSLTNVVFPNGLTSIGDFAFNKCTHVGNGTTGGYRGIELPNTVTNIGSEAFHECRGMYYFIIPTSVKTLGTDITRWCDNLVNIIGPRRFKSYFQNCNPTAFYTYNDVKVTFDANGGEVDTESMLVDIYSHIDELPVPLRWNHKFLGWFTAAEGGTQVTTSTSMSKDMTLYARWESVDYVWSYSENSDGGITITGASPKEGNMEIPSEIDGKVVTAIGSRSFYSADALTGVKIPGTVRTIGGTAFGWSGLVFAVIPDSVINIAWDAFKCCNDLVQLVVPQNVEIGLGAFQLCPKLADANGFVIINNTVYGYFGGEADVVIPDGITGIGYGVFWGNSDVQSISIPETVTRIEEWAFYACRNLQSVVIPQGVTRIERVTFESCTSLTNVVIPDCVTDIEEAAFADCSSLTNIVIPASVTNIGEQAFYFCESLETVTFVGGMEHVSIAADAFDRTPWGGANIPFELVIRDGVVSRYHGLVPESLTLADYAVGIQLTRIGDYAFQKSDALRSVVIPPGVKIVGAYAFWECENLSSVTLPAGLRDIGVQAFWSDNLTEVYVPASVTNIGAYAFEQNFSLRKVYLPNTLEGKIDESNVFSRCADDLDVVYYEVPMVVINLDGNEGVVEDPSITVKKDCPIESLPIPTRNGYMFLGWFTAAEGGDEVTADMVVTGGMTLYAHWMAADEYVWSFERITGGVMITGVTPAKGFLIIPAVIEGQVVKAIGHNAFIGCDEIIGVKIPEGCSRINGVAFEDCRNLHVAYLPENWKPYVGIVEGAFVRCASDFTINIYNLIHNRIVLNANGGEVSEAEISVTQSLPIGELPNPVWSGDGRFLFLGWFTAAEGGTQVTAETVVTGDMTLYAHWAESPFTATGGDAPWGIDGDGCWRSGTITDAQSTWAELAVTNAPCVVSFKWKTSSESGYDMLHCYLDDVEIVSAISGIMIDWTNVTFAVTEPGNHTIRFQYTKDGSMLNGEDCGWVKDFTIEAVVTHTVALNANGGKLENSGLSVINGATIGVLLEPVYSGHVFLGWFTAAEGGCEVTAETVVTGDMTLYAHWEEIVYAYSYIDNGDGTVTLSKWDEQWNWIGEGISPSPVGEFTVPAVIDGKQVVAIGDNFFDDYYGLTSLVIPASVTNISCYALPWAYDLTNITVAAANSAYKSVDGILYTKDGKTLVACPRAKGGDIVVASGTEHVGVYAFYGNNCMTSVLFPDGLKDIWSSAFAYCPNESFTSVAIPTTVETIGESAFGYCSYLANVTFSGDESQIDIAATAFVGTPYDAAKPFALVVNEYDALVGIHGVAPETLVISNYLNGSALSGIGDYALSGGRYDTSSMTNVVVPEGVTWIGYGSFADDTALESVALPESLTSIGSDAFYNCTALREIRIPVGVSTIYDPFWGCTNLTVHAPTTLRDTFSVPEGCTIEYYNVPVRTVTFNANGGTVDGGATTAWTIYEGRRLDSADEYYDNYDLPTPVLTSYDFLGWFTAAVGGDEVTAETVVTGDMTLYAHWEEIQVPSNDNFADAMEITGIYGALLATNEHATSEDGESAYYDSDATLWFKWIAPTNGLMTIDTFGSGFDTILGVYTGVSIDGLREIAFNDDADNDADNYESQVSFVAQMGVPYLIVVGGYSSNTGVINLNWSLTPNEVYTVTYDPGKYGIGTGKTVAKLKDETITIEGALFTTEGHRQTGWRSSETSHITHPFGSSYSLNESLTLYPYWSANTYTVHFDGNGGVGTMEDMAMQYAVPTNLSLNAFSKEYCVLEGWTTNRNGTVVYADGARVRNLTSDHDVVVTLYAKWAVSPSVAYAVTVDPVAGTTVAVPKTWIDERSALVSASGGDAAAALVSSAANGRKVWECYVLGLDPESTTNDFRIVSFPMNADGTPDLANIVFDPPQAAWNVPDARAVLKGATTLEGPWRTVTEVNKAQFRFFKVVVRIGDADDEPDDAHDMVQLWEGGPYWATRNIGAEEPWEYGYYFWWGDTVGYTRSGGTWGDYVFGDGSGYYFGVTWVSSTGAQMSSSPFTEDSCPTYGKYNSALLSAGYIDSTGNLVAAHDAATAHLGSPWRMPTDAEFSALISNCTTTWITTNGVSGRLVTGKGAYADRSIFLPAAGCGDGSNLYGPGSYGNYWSSTPSSDDSYSAWGLYFNSSNFYRSNYYRYYGQSVRPVRGFDQ